MPYIKSGASKCERSIGRSSSSILTTIPALLMVPLYALGACGGVDTDLGPDGWGDVGQVSDELTSSPGVTFHNPGASLDACFISGGFDTQKTWVKESIYRTWEFVAEITLNWLQTCPATGTLVRIGIQETADPEQDGWAKSSGTAALASEQAINDANQGTPFAQKPSIKLWLQPTPTDRGRVEYLGVHEFGHVLGFDDEGSNSEATCATIAANGTTPNGNPLTEYDIDSIMNYCNNFNNGAGSISGYDIQGAQGVYGMGRRYVAALIAVLQG